jgi:hypothetical protein
MHYNAQCMVSRNRIYNELHFFRGYKTVQSKLDYNLITYVKKYMYILVLNFIGSLLALFGYSNSAR